MSLGLKKAWVWIGSELSRQSCEIRDKSGLALCKVKRPLKSS